MIYYIYWVQYVFQSVLTAKFRMARDLKYLSQTLIAEHQ